MAADDDWRRDLSRCLQLFLTAPSHPARRMTCALYVAGLIGLGDHKSVQPMAVRAEGVSFDRLHHFIAAGIWDEAPPERAPVAEANRLVGSPDAILVVDDMALPNRSDRPGKLGHYCPLQQLDCGITLPVGSNPL